jgi:UDP-N-acetylglucosamine--N-acetylmuramyl-(pentapeptide) pyrophosphoryl-undecaprenol N-acetylglucosamine transferase
VSGVAKIMKSTRAARAWFEQIKPDCVVGFGGYVSIPVARAAQQLGVPVVLHEQNSIMGMANKYLARRAQAICLTYAAAAEGLKLADAPGRTHVTGNPVRARVVEASAQEGRQMLGVPEDARMLVVFGGSLGARHINQAVCALKGDLLARPDLYVVHITGPKEFDQVKAELALTDEEAKRWLLFDYQNNMPEVLAACTCVVSRAGATSLAEISARGIPALLVPYPYAAEDHQTKNAAEYVAAGAAFCVKDDQLDSDTFATQLAEMIDSPQTRARMTAAAAQFGGADSANKLAEIVMAQLK